MDISSMNILSWQGQKAHPLTLSKISIMGVVDKTRGYEDKTFRLIRYLRGCDRELIGRAMEAK